MFKTNCNQHRANLKQSIKMLKLLEILYNRQLEIKNYQKINIFHYNNKKSQLINYLFQNNNKIKFSKNQKNNNQKIFKIQYLVWK